MEPSYYEINVALNGSHFFATHKRSIKSKTELNRLLEVFKKAFPKDEGYVISATGKIEYGIGMEVYKEGDVYDDLIDICLKEHARCNDNCPVYALQTQDEKDNPDFCQCYGNSEKMFNFIKERSNN